MAMTPRFPAQATSPDTPSARVLRKRQKDRQYQRECRAKRKQKLLSLENEVHALHTQIARLYQPLHSRKLVTTDTQVRVVQHPLEIHARALVMRFFQVYQYGYSVSMAPLQEHFLRSILDADVEGADFRRPDAFVQQWRLNGQHFAVYVLEPQGWKTHTVDGSVMVTVEVMLYLRFLRQTIGTLFPTLKSGAVHFEFVQPLTTGTTAVLATYSFIVNTRGKITSLLTNLQLLESLRRVLRSLDNVVRLTEVFKPIMRRLTIITDERSRQEIPSGWNVEQSESLQKKAGSISPLRRSFSRGIPGRKNRNNSPAVNHRVKVVTEETTPPSATASRIRALALAVRARHSLGIKNPAQRKYLLQTSDGGPEGSDVGVDLLMAGIQTNLEDDTKSNNARNRPSSSNIEVMIPAEPTSSRPAIQTRKPSLHPALKSATMTRGSITKASLQRVNTIRGDLTSVVRPYEAKFLDPAAISSPTHNFDARLTCAHSLYKLSCQSGNELAIIDGGAIAQIADFSDAEDPRLLRYSGAVLVNVTTDLSMLGEFSTNDGVSALLELSWAPLIDVKVACATALCRLSLNQERAALLARNRAITELMSMLVIPHTPLQQLAVSCIVNLIFHGNSFPDRVFLGEPHAIQSPLGLVNVLSLFAASPATSQFVVETLFNLSLYRASCLSVIRGGGAEILSTIVTQLCKLVDGGGSSSSRYLYSMGAQTPAWVTDMSICMKLLRLAADTLANFSVFLEYHNLVGSHGIKMLILMLSGALRDVGNFNVSMANVERFRCTSVSCSRSLVNFSCNTELRRQNFPVELIHLTSKLALMDHQRYSATAQDARLLLRNTIRALCNLSFEASCRTTIMEIPNLFTMLNAIIILPSVVERDVESFPAEDQTQDEKEFIAVESRENRAVGGIRLEALETAPLWYLSPSQSLNSSSFPWTVDMSEDVKEDALIMLLNLAQESTCSNELLRTLDGKLIAAAAEDFGHSRRLRYIYNSVLSNLLFDNCLQQLVYGDQVVRALVNGFYFFEANDDLKDPLRRDAMSPSSERTQFQELNLAFEDDQERFLASMYIIANELMDVANIELVVALVLPCMQTYLDLIEPILSNASSAFAQRVLLQRQLPIVSYASASLFALTRAANQRRDSHKHVIYSEETEAVLISVSALPSGAGGGGSSSGLLKGGAAQAFCAATLYHLCASTSANQRIMQGLINCCNTNEESQPLLACSAAFAITSFTPEGCQQLVECAHLARALNRLGRSSHVECQQYAAIAACNVSTVACVWTSAELKDFIVVAILRANSIQTKQIHAKTLSNLLSHTDSRAQVVEDGVLYALMKLSQVVLSSSAAPVSPNIARERRGSTQAESSTSISSSADEVFSIGLRALFNLSCDHQYHHKLLSNGIMSYLSTAVEYQQQGSSGGGGQDATRTAFLFQEDTPPKQQQQQQNLASNLSTETRRLALAIICNLTSYEENHEELIRAQVTEIICNYVDEDIELRVSAAMALRNLSCRQPWVEMLCERKILQLLISCMECKHPVARQFGVEALANCSLVTDSLHLFGEMKVPRAAMKLLEIVAKSVVDTSSNEVVSWEFTNSNTTQHERGHTGASTYMAALKCLQNIAYDDALALVVMEEKVVLRLIPLIEHRDLGNDISACELAASLAHTLAGKAKCAEALLRQRTVSLCSLLHRHHASSSIIAQECVRVLMLLSTYQPIQLQLCETKVVHVVVNICGSGGASTSVPRNLRLRECGAVTIRNLTLSVTEHQMLFYDKSDRQESLQGAVVSNSEQQGNRLKTLQNYNSDKKDLPVSLVLERHMLQGIKYFQDEIASGRTSDRIMLEASAAIANLSTTKLFRIAMVRLGVIPTLLQVMNHTKTKTQPTSTPSQRPTSPPLRARKSNHTTINLLLQICAATLHRLVVEDDAAVDTRNQLVPSLLSVLRQTDEDLQQVRYECEKISIFSSNTDDTITSPSSHGSRRRSHLHPMNAHPRASICLPSAQKRLVDGTVSDEFNGVSSSVLLPAGAAVTQCVRQTFREQKWMVYLLKTILSSQAMIPHLEKKQMRTMGLPKLCFQELAPASICETPLPASNSDINNSRSTSAPNESNTLCDGNYRKGYLLPVNMEKHVLSRINGFDEIVPASMVTALPRAKSAGTSSTRPIISSGRSSSANSSRTQASALIDPLGHTRKFNRQMQLTRRNNRRGDNCLPPV